MADGRLSEISPEGRKFVTSVSVTVGNKHVVVFVTMEVGSVASSITRIEVDPKCPLVVRDLLALGGTWTHRSFAPPHPVEHRRIRGWRGACTRNPGNRERTIPFVVVSRIDGQTALPKLDERLAVDLAGIANVYCVDEQASWALTDILRKPLSTYSGAVRIYWPRLSINDDPFRHQLWTASRLQGIERDALERIRRQVRTIIMRASAISVVRPTRSTKFVEQRPEPNRPSSKRKRSNWSSRLRHSPLKTSENSPTSMLPRTMAFDRCLLKANRM